MGRNCHLRFADDILLTADGMDDARVMLEKLYHAFLEIGRKNLHEQSPNYDKSGAKS